MSMRGRPFYVHGMKDGSAAHGVDLPAVHTRRWPGPALAAAATLQFYSNGVDYYPTIVGGKPKYRAWRGVRAGSSLK